MSNTYWPFTDRDYNEKEGILLGIDVQSGTYTIISAVNPKGGTSYSEYIKTAKRIFPYMEDLKNVYSSYQNTTDKTITFTQYLSNHPELLL